MRATAEVPRFSCSADQFVQRPEDRVLIAFGQDANGGSQLRGGDSRQIKRVGENVLTLDAKVRRQGMVWRLTGRSPHERHDHATHTAL